MNRFKPAQKKAVVQDVILQIESAIVSGALDNGEKLPPERELQSEFQASRTTIREALRVLEQKGLITIRKGKGGGSFVEPKSDLRFSENLDLMIRLGQVTLSQLFDFRCNIQVMAFESAIYKANAEDIIRLRDIYSKMEKAHQNHRGDHQAFFEIEKTMHREIVALSHNPLYGLVLKTITASTWKVMRFLPNSVSEMKAALLDWHDILEGLERRDIHKATTVIRAHHLNYRRVYEKYLTSNNLNDRTVVQALEDFE